jgi:hypothetical protein
MVVTGGPLAGVSGMVEQAARKAAWARANPASRPIVRVIWV